MANGLARYKLGTVCTDELRCVEDAGERNLKLKLKKSKAKISEERSCHRP